MEIQGAEEILMDLNTHDMTSLMLDPVFNYDNIFQRNLGVYKFITGKKKVKMLHLNSTNYNLQPKTSCDNWNPTPGFRLRPTEMSTCEFELNGEQCPETFEEECLRNIRGAVEEGNRFRSLFGQTREYDPLEVAIMLQIRRGLTNDLYKIAWFGNSNFSDYVEKGYCNIDHMSPKEQAKMISMLEHCNGWWSEIEARACLPASERWGRVRYLDTNNGTITGNALRPENICAYLDQMISRADPILLYWNRNKPRSEWPCFLLQRGLFEALRKYYEMHDCCDAYRLKIDGIEMEGVLTYKGYQVIEVAEWDMFDFECGLISESTGFSKKQRALFTAKENLCGLSQAESLEGRPETSFAVAKDPSLKAKGKSYMYGCFGFGFGIAQPALMVAGWNSSTVYA